MNKYLRGFALALLVIPIFAFANKNLREANPQDCPCYETWRAVFEASTCNDVNELVKRMGAGPGVVVSYRNVNLTWDTIIPYFGNDKICVYARMSGGLRCSLWVGALVDPEPPQPNNMGCDLALELENLSASGEFYSCGAALIEIQDDLENLSSCN